MFLWNHHIFMNKRIIRSHFWSEKLRVQICPWEKCKKLATYAKSAPDILEQSFLKEGPAHQVGISFEVKFFFLFPKSLKNLLRAKMMAAKFLQYMSHLGNFPSHRFLHVFLISKTPRKVYFLTNLFAIDLLKRKKIWRSQRYNRKTEN